MPARSSFDYAVIRVVPRVEREEFVNVGVIVFCRTRRFLDCRVKLDSRRLAALAPTLDQEEVRAQLEVLRLVCAGGPAAGPIGALPPAERFHWLTAPRSTVVQTSPVHAGLTADPARTLDHLLETMVCLPSSPQEGGRT